MQRFKVTPHTKQTIINAMHDGHWVAIYELDDEKARSYAQNRLYWQVLTKIASDTGQTKDELHIFCKRRFLSKILARDDKDLAYTFALVKACQNQKDYEKLANGVASLMSTTKATSAQMSEYVGEIINYFGE